MTSTLQEILAEQTRLLSSLTCSTLSCLRNRTRTTTDNLLQLTIDANMEYSLRPLEDPFPFDQISSVKDDSFNPLRYKFFQHTDRLLPEHLHILLTTTALSISSSIISSSLTNRNQFVDYLIDYAYTQWNSTINQFEFDRLAFDYHQDILAPILQYAKYVSNERMIHILERTSSKYQSELPLTFGYVLAPSMSVYNETYLEANDIDREESLLMMDIFANILHHG
jgi:hypothetical protein